MDDRLLAAAKCLRASHNVLVFTGAGISAESGIPTFRDDDGLWQRFPPEHFATWRGLISTALRRPREFSAFVQAVVDSIANSTPNAAHITLASAEQHQALTVVTQNIDGLHRAAGSTVVHEIHGTIYETIYRSGRSRALLSRRELQQIARKLERASHGLFALIRTLWSTRQLIGLGLRGLYFPKIIMFGDALAEPDWTNALAAARLADCVLQIGCSGVVMPAAMLPHEAKKNGATIIVIDPSEPKGDIYLRGKATDIVPRLFALAFGTDMPNSAS